MVSDNRESILPLSTYEFQPEALTVQDAFIILAIRLMGDRLRDSATARDYVMGVAREMPQFSMEREDNTRGRLNKYINWKDSAAMEALFEQALRTLAPKYREEALKWVAEIAVGRLPTKRSVSLVHRIGTSLGFSAEDVSGSLDQVRSSRQMAAESNN